MNKNYNQNKVGNSIPILDSMLITPTNLSNCNKLYNIKIVDCGSYTQVYVYENKKLKKIKDDDLSLVKINLPEDKENHDLELKDSFNIEERNIIRSKLECQRIAKAG